MSFRVHLSALAFLGAAVTLTALAPTSARAQADLSLGFSNSSSSPSQLNYIAEGRLLNQASFGPTANDILTVHTMGLANWIKYQMNLSAPAIPMPIPPADYQVGDCFGWECYPDYYWWHEALFGQDQLRQRVAYELSKLFVVSYTQVDPRYFPYYFNVLQKDAFGNWLTLMQDVSQSAAMGQYLNAANSLYTGTGGHADENLGRELMQLFSIGTVALNNDGSQKLDGSGNPIPNYTSAEVQDMARAFTGWTLANNLDGTSCKPATQPMYYSWAFAYGAQCPMTPLAQYHDPGQKTLLRGTVLPAGQTPEQDWNAALTNIFEDPSLPPFVSLRLIQSLVKSNPSPAYINRISNVFINDGSGTRGNLSAVIYAILMDSEARVDDNGGVADPNTGRLRDATEWYTSVLRAAQAQEGMPYPWVSCFNNLQNELHDMDEDPHFEPSVFSFYSPLNTITVEGKTLSAPEFQLENGQTIMWMMTHLQDAVLNKFGMSAATANEFTLDLSATSPLGLILQQSGVDEMIYILNQILMHGTMSAQMAQTIKDGIATDTNYGDMVRDAVYLVVSSPQYRVMI